MTSENLYRAPVKRVGSVIGLAEQAVEEYERLHASVWPEVLEQIAKSNIRNYSIFRMGHLLFSYYEYIGDDFAYDMSEMANDPITQEWWKLCTPLQKQIPETPENEWWMTIPEVFHCD